ncbi:MAG: GNAT family N-acetyltransferase [Geodermatophilaceae bacterium]|nr:GNAT family N-acetyltransferase [Geodermatophilaceae bacterium]
MPHPAVLAPAVHRVDPSRQGQGLGSRLLETGVARCDRDHLPAYLEARTLATAPSTSGTASPLSARSAPATPRRSGRCSEPTVDRRTRTAPGQIR